MSQSELELSDETMTYPVVDLEKEVGPANQPGRCDFESHPEGCDPTPLATSVGTCTTDTAPACRNGLMRR